MSLSSLEIEQKLQEIDKRNHKVDFDTKWETSNFRKLLILITTFYIPSTTF